MRTWLQPLKKAQSLNEVHNLKAQSCTEVARCLSVQGCNPIIMPLNTRWPAGFSSPSWWWWCKQATQGTRKSKVVRTCCVLPPLAPLHQNPTNPNKALCTLPPLRPHEKPRSRKLPGKKHNLTISDKNIKVIEIIPKVKCWMLMRKGGGVI